MAKYCCILQQAGQSVTPAIPDRNAKQLAAISKNMACPGNPDKPLPAISA